MNLKKYSILIVDDDPDVLTALRLLLKTELKEVVVEKRPANLPDLVARHNFDLVLLDMNFSSSVNTGNEGIYWLAKIKEQSPSLPVILITAYADVDLAVRSLKQGAADFVVKPWDNSKILATIADTLKKAAGLGKKGINQSSSELIGSSEGMRDIFTKLEKIAPTDANILILGENGTGKDLLAHAIHKRSLRSGRNFVKTDVGALTETLFESELFGHKKGAFTDAREDRMGRIEAANGGTLFLDEIGNISLQQQAKLLTVLQNRQVTRLGSNEAIPLDVRLICATNASLTDLANESRFRRDFVYRIKTVEIAVPPLRERLDDIPQLIEHFGAIYAAKYFKPAPLFSSEAVKKIQRYNFPGNVRELQYVIERAVIMADSNRLAENDIVFSPLEQGEVKTSETNTSKLSDVERKTILRVIEKHNGNITRAARELGITRTALYRRLSKYDI